MPLAGQKVLAADFVGFATDNEMTDETGFTSTTYTGGGTPCGMSFTVPTSGRVLILWHARMESNTANTRVLASVAVRTGSTVGSGTDVSAASDSDAIESSESGTGGSQQRIGASSHRTLTGLTAGSTYNVRVEFKMSAAGNGDIFDRDVTVIPIP